MIPILGKDSKSGSEKALPCKSVFKTYLWIRTVRPSACMEGRGCPWCGCTVIHRCHGQFVGYSVVGASLERFEHYMFRSQYLLSLFPLANLGDQTWQKECQPSPHKRFPSYPHEWLLKKSWRVMTCHDVSPYPCLWTLGAEECQAVTQWPGNPSWHCRSRFWEKKNRANENCSEKIALICN